MALYSLAINETSNCHCFHILTIAQSFKMSSMEKEKSSMSSEHHPRRAGGSKYCIVNTHLDARWSRVFLSVKSVKRKEPPRMYLAALGGSHHSGAGSEPRRC
jgi:hypothetical protein